VKETTKNYGASYTPPEVFDGHNPYDGEKADVWASSFVLLALYAATRFGE
jgi:hypothetical protein